ncbi:MAG TPA: gamma-glutamyl-gamma-aminobutyrate hydrolase family protein [Candidatus Limnocylindria bacterium]|jgi:putative glutamine amidotransferase
MPSRPRILVTVHGPAQEAMELPTWKKFSRYVDAVREAGGEVTLIDPMATAGERATAFAEMDGLLLPGGADVDPTLYGEAPQPLTQVEPGRDELEDAAWAAAQERGLPVLGVCRGMQAINVFCGGSLLQHVDGHDSPTPPSPEAWSHPIRLLAGTRLAAILAPDGAGDEVMEVNSYHHQALRPDQLGTGLRVGATTPDGELVEAFEAAAPDRWVIGVQNHPERSEFTPPAFRRLWQAFVAAADRP